MTLRERIVETIIVNLAWTMVWLELTGHFGARWIMEIWHSIGV